MSKNYDAIIIGGGVNGGAIAFNLAKRGMKVLVLEKDRLVSKASGAAAGMLGAQAELNGQGPLFDLAKASRAMFPNLAEELNMLSGIDIELLNKGMLKVARSSSEQRELSRIIDIHTQQGEPAEWLSGKQVKKREPALSSEITGAMYLAKDGHVSAPKLAWGFLKSASALGCVIKEGIEVHRFHYANGQIRGIATDAGDFAGDNVIVTGGAWSEKLLKQTGLQIEMYPVKGECFSVRTREPLLARTIFTENCYLVPKKGGRIIVGATVIPYTFNQQVTLEGISGLMEHAKKLVPSIAQAEWEGAWAGIRPQTVDGLPYLGEHPECRGLFVAAGHFRNGILLSPITGRVMADIVEGNPPSIDISRFKLDRLVLTNHLIRK